MKRRTLLFFYCLLAASFLRAQAQKKIILEKIRYGTVINYLEQPELQQVFAHNLNELLLKYQHPPLSEMKSLPLQRILDKKDLDQKYDYRNTDNSLLHLLIDIFEIPANIYFSSPGMPEDPAMRSAAKTVFYLDAVLMDGNNHTVQYEPVYLIVKDNPGPGMGNESSIVPILPKTFVEVMKTGLNMLLNPKNNLQHVSVGVAPAYMMDNYLVPALAKKERIYVDTARGFYHFVYHDTKQLLRQGQPMYEEIIWKGKKARTYPEAVTSIIRLAPNYNNAEFIFLRSDARDVYNNKNYQLQLMIQIDHDDAWSVTQSLTGFLPGNIHVLYHEKDTLALFSITKSVTDTSKKVFPGHIYNGLDTNSAVRITDIQVKNVMAEIAGRNSMPQQRGTRNTQPTSWNTLFSYVVKGKIKGQDFTINYGGTNKTIREFYLGKQLVCIAQGKTIPEKFVVFDASLQADILNPLLLIGFNPYFL